MTDSITISTIETPVLDNAGVAVGIMFILYIYYVFNLETENSNFSIFHLPAAILK